MLTQLSDFVPDDFINRLLPPHRGLGRRVGWSSAQLFRLLLLGLLTPAHSFNLPVELLPEQRAWRRFARLPNRRQVPTASILHEFRHRLGVGSLRRVNRHLLLPLLEGLAPERKTVALIDSTDLPAATSSYKKADRPLLRARRSRGRARDQDRAEPLVCRLQEAHHALVARVITPSVSRWCRWCRGWPPGNRGDTLFLPSSVRYCMRHLDWVPDMNLLPPY